MLISICSSVYIVEMNKASVTGLILPPITDFEHARVWADRHTLPYFLECFSPSNCIRPLIVFAQQSGLNVYCVRPHIVFARCSKRCARAIVIRKDNPLSGKVSINRKVKSVWMVRKKCQKKLQMQQKWQKEKKLEVQQKRGFLK